MTGSFPDTDGSPNSTNQIIEDLWERIRVQAFPTTGITYDAAGNVQTVTENGVTTTYTYNSDGSVASDSRAGVTRTYTYDGSGNLTGIAS